MSLRLLVCRSVFTAFLLGAGALPAAAQIFSWRDTSGNLILSNLRPGPDAAAIRLYAVPAASDARVTAFTPSSLSTAYDDLIVEHSRRNGVRQSLVRAVIQVESAFNPVARSPKGAIGLMQLMPATARQFGVANAYNPEENVRAGVAYLRQLLDRYDNDEVLALAAYNAGPGAVDRHGQRVPPYQETKNYVMRVNTIAGQPVEKPAALEMYRSVELVDGRPVVKYTDRKPD